MKGRTRWFPRRIEPVRHGEYECVVRLCGGAYARWNCVFDGEGFLVPFPMSVVQWRGLTKKAAMQKGTKE